MLPNRSGLSRALAAGPRLKRRDAHLAGLLPGVLLCGAVAAAACAIEHVEAVLVGRTWLEALVLAILIGAGLRSAWTPGPLWNRGVAFSGKALLEMAVVLLGAATSFRMLAEAGPGLVIGIGAVVVASIAASFTLCRFIGLSRRMAMLVACGNSICGNSAIAAAAPVVGADADETTTAIAFTAVLGIPVVLGLPWLVPLLGLSDTQFGVLAGLTVYAVPQVIAATAPVGSVAIQVGTLVKLVRVLMLGPVVVTLSMLAARRRDAFAGAGPSSTDGGLAAEPIRARTVVPWFILAFLTLATLHSLDLLPLWVQQPAAGGARFLTVLSMAALGLGVDVRAAARTGRRVVGAAGASLLLLGALGFGLIGLLHIA